MSSYFDEHRIDRLEEINAWPSYELNVEERTKFRYIVSGITSSMNFELRDVEQIIDRFLASIINHPQLVELDWLYLLYLLFLLCIHHGSPDTYKHLKKSGKLPSNDVTIGNKVVVIDVINLNNVREPIVNMKLSARALFNHLNSLHESSFDTRNAILSVTEALRNRGNTPASKLDLHFLTLSYAKYSSTNDNQIPDYFELVEIASLFN